MASQEHPQPNNDVKAAHSNTSAWKARLSVSLVMLALALVSLIIMRIHQNSYWVFSWIMAGIDAVLSIWLIWFLKRQSNKTYPSTIWQQILHWLGLLAVMYLLAIFIDHGAIGQAEAGLIALLSLALTIYLAGIYTDTTFILVGITLAIMAAGIILIKSYLLLVMVPVVIIIALIIIVLINRDRKTASTLEEENEGE